MRSVPLIPRGTTGQCFVRWFASLRDYLWGIQSSPAWLSLSLFYFPAMYSAVYSMASCAHVLACVGMSGGAHPPGCGARMHSTRAPTQAPPLSLTRTCTRICTSAVLCCVVMCCDVCQTFAGAWVRSCLSIRVMHAGPMHTQTFFQFERNDLCQRERTRRDGDGDALGLCKEARCDAMRWSFQRSWNAGHAWFRFHFFHFFSFSSKLITSPMITRLSSITREVKQQCVDSEDGSLSPRGAARRGHRNTPLKMVRPFECVSALRATARVTVTCVPAPAARVVRPEADSNPPEGRAL